MEAVIHVAGKVAHNKPLHATCETHAREGRRYASRRDDGKHSR
jgi:hypothetical protein